ncbi:MAG: hypothetical protein WD733_14860 [Bryobacterales bacterium]
MRGPNETNWDAIAKAACEAFRGGVNEWIGRAQIQGGRVIGPNAELTPGSLISAVNFEPLMIEAMTKANVPSDIARAFAGELWGAWKEWAEGFRMLLPGMYPQLAAFPGPMAPPIPGRGTFPLSQGSSTGEQRLHPGMLSMKLTAALRLHVKAGSGAKEAIEQVVKWIDSSFQEWKLMAQVNGSAARGRGPVPNFAPPYVPVGPVIMGDNLPVPGHLPVFLGPRFGKILL